MPIVFVAERAGAENDACSRTYDGYFVTKFIFFVFFTFTDALNIRLMDGINLTGMKTEIERRKLYLS
jgi:hypothetical protein